jgi:hypothetical protein
MGELVKVVSDDVGSKSITWLCDFSLIILHGWIIATNTKLMQVEGSKGDLGGTNQKRSQAGTEENDEGVRRERKKQSHRGVRIIR